MPPNSSEMHAVVSVIERYIHGYIHADELILRDVFAPDAIMNGYVGDRLVEGSPEPFITRIASEPPLAAQDLELKYDITAVDVAGDAASVIVKEYGFGPFSFTDFMHLLNRGGEWKIVSKTFSTF